MSSSSIENKIQGLLDRLRTENNSRDRDPYRDRVMDIPSMPTPRNRPVDCKFVLPSLNNLHHKIHLIHQIMIKKIFFI